MELGARFAAWRQFRGLSQKQIAEKTGRSRALISQIESGETNPSRKTYDLIIAALGITTAEFEGLVPVKAVA